MKSTSSIHAKRIGDTEPGELIRIKIVDEFLLGIVLSNDDGRYIVGTLDPISNEVQYQVHISLSKDQRCISYGVDWLIEPILTDASWPAHSRFNWTPGALFLSNDEYSTVFRHHASSCDHGEILYDLSNSVLLERFPDGAAPITAWKIWASQRDYTHPGAQPLFEVTDVKIFAD
ncbi:hypothetical protein HB779_21435 (plasmid) [Phyllobacterium sp. 628]|uniref:hypothetical protein n=1 Tax=Phyllobacterium sp. 628 TaxID=2718938 RepID=UPI0016622AB3|nr:hypothetical protein [Phyllobacterium sp. 628]QND54483.1 hypothetical protein HB779_21435 [Phyllobacterium sp. 628]